MKQELHRKRWSTLDTCSRVLLSALLVAAVGCESNSQRRQIVSGQVKLDQQPLDQVVLVFTPKRAGLAAAAVVDKGQYSFSHTDGPTPGEYFVRVNLLEPEVEQRTEPQSHTLRQPLKVPRSYQQNGELTATITDSSDQQLNFNLFSRRP